MFAISRLGKLIQVALWGCLASQPRLIPNPTRTSTMRDPVSKNKTRGSALSSQYSAWSLSWNKNTNGDKETHIGKEVRECLFAEEMILYVRDPKDSTQKLTDLRYTFWLTSSCQMIADLHFVVICYSNNTTQAQTLPSKDFSCVDLSPECHTSLVTDDLNSSILMFSDLSSISVFLVLVSVAMLIASPSTWKR